MTTKTDILKDLSIKEKFERRTLKKYDDLLFKVFQVIYEVDGIVEWERIFRFSPTSNFVMISGTAIIEEASSTVTRDVSFTIPFSMLDDGSTPYQIADAAKSIITARMVMTPKEFHDKLRDKNFTMDDLSEYLPELDRLAEQAKDLQIEDIKLPPHLDGFDLSELSEDQKQRLMLSEIAKQ